MGYKPTPSEIRRAEQQDTPVPSGAKTPANARVATPSPASGPPEPTREPTGPADSSTGNRVTGDTGAKERPGRPSPAASKAAGGTKAARARKATKK